MRSFRRRHDTTQACGVDIHGTIRVVAIYFDPEHLILLKLSIRLGFGAHFAVELPSHRWGEWHRWKCECRHQHRNAINCTLYIEIETSIVGVYRWCICVAGETASSVNWQTTINSISILESANWSIKKYTTRGVRRMENRNFIFDLGMLVETKRE